MKSPQDESAHGSPDDSTYGTPTDESATTKPNEKPSDAQLVVFAGRSLKNMLVDVMGLLEERADTKIFMQGDITLRIEGRESYTIKLLNEDSAEPSNLKVRIDNTGTGGSSSNPAEKRKVDQTEETDDAPVSPSKRARIDDALPSPPPLPPNNNDDAEGGLEQPEFERIMTKFSNISAQIKWVEECRRVAGQAHDAREEKWRSTSATFHDDNRKAAERHNMWMTAEMGWQRNMLIQLAKDVKGLYPLTHSLKWETPPQMYHAAPPTPMPIARDTRDKPLGKPYVPKPRTLQPNSKSSSGPR